MSPKGGGQMAIVRILVLNERRSHAHLRKKSGQIEERLRDGDQTKFLRTQYSRQKGIIYDLNNRYARYIEALPKYRSFNALGHRSGCLPFFGQVGKRRILSEISCALVVVAHRTGLESGRRSSNAVVVLWFQ